MIGGQSVVNPMAVYSVHLHSQFGHLVNLIRRGRYEHVVALVRSQPAVLALRDRMGRSALHHCADCCRSPPSTTTSTSGAKASAAICTVLIKMRPDMVEWQDNDGNTALHLAVINGDVNLVKALVHHMTTSQINLADHELHTAVHWAVVAGQRDALSTVLDHGAQASTGDIYGAYPLHYATQTLFLDVSKPKRDRRAISVAIIHDLLSRPKQMNNVNCVDHELRTPLIWAASSGNQDALLVLVKAGAQISQQDKDGLSALHCASSRGHYGCVHTLITMCGADVHQLDSGGCTPLFYAVALGHADCVRLLIESGAKLDHQDNKGRTAAHCGASKGQLETLMILKENGANLWMKNARGDLPLHDAVKSGRTDLVKWLLDQNASTVNEVNLYGRSALHIAAFNHNLEMCRLLIGQFGAQLNPVMKIRSHYMTPLDAALQNASPNNPKDDDLVQYLIKNGAQSTEQMDNIAMNTNWPLDNNNNQSSFDPDGMDNMDHMDKFNVEQLTQLTSDIANKKLQSIRIAEQHTAHKHDHKVRSVEQVEEKNATAGQDGKLPHLFGTSTGQNAGAQSSSNQYRRGQSSKSISSSSSDGPMNDSIVHSASARHAHHQHHHPHNHHITDRVKNVREYETILTAQPDADGGDGAKHTTTHLKQAIITNVYLTTPTSPGIHPAALTPVETIPIMHNGTATPGAALALPIYYVKRVPPLKKLSGPSTKSKRMNGKSSKKSTSTATSKQHDASAAQVMAGAAAATSGTVQVLMEAQQIGLNGNDEHAQTILDEQLIVNREEMVDEDDDDQAQQEEDLDKKDAEQEQEEDIEDRDIKDHEQEDGTTEPMIEGEQSADQSPISDQPQHEISGLSDRQEMAGQDEQDKDSGVHFQSEQIDQANVRVERNIADDHVDDTDDTGHFSQLDSTVDQVDQNEDNKIDQSDDDEHIHKTGQSQMDDTDHTDHTTNVDHKETIEQSDQITETVKTIQQDDDDKTDIDERTETSIEPLPGQDRDGDDEEQGQGEDKPQAINEMVESDRQSIQSMSEHHQTDVETTDQITKLTSKQGSLESMHSVTPDQDMITVDGDGDKGQDRDDDQQSQLDQQQQQPEAMQHEAVDSRAQELSDGGDGEQSQPQQTQLEPEPIQRRGSYTKRASQASVQSASDQQYDQQDKTLDQIETTNGFDDQQLITPDAQPDSNLSPGPVDPSLSSSFGPIRQLKGKKKSYEHVRPKVDSYWSDEYHHQHQTRSSGQRGQAGHRTKRTAKHCGSMGHLACTAHDHYARIDPKFINQTVEKYLRKYYLERQLFEELYDLKRYQIRTGRTNEPQSVRRLVDRFRREIKAPGMSDFKGPFTYRAYEMYLYDLLRQLSRSNQKKIAYLTKSISYEDLTSSFERLQADDNDEAMYDSKHEPHTSRMAARYHISDDQSVTTDDDNQQQRQHSVRLRNGHHHHHQHHLHHKPSSSMMMLYESEPLGMVVDYKYEYHKSQHKTIAQQSQSDQDDDPEMVDVIKENLYKRTDLHGNKMDEMKVTRKIVQKRATPSNKEQMAEQNGANGASDKSPQPNNDHGQPHHDQVRKDRTVRSIAIAANHTPPPSRCYVYGHCPPTRQSLIIKMNDAKLARLATSNRPSALRRPYRPMRFVRRSPCLSCSSSGSCQGSHNQNYFLSNQANEMIHRRWNTIKHHQRNNMNNHGHRDCIIWFEINKNYRYDSA